MRTTQALAVAIVLMSLPGCMRSGEFAVPAPAVGDIAEGISKAWQGQDQAPATVPAQPAPAPAQPNVPATGTAIALSEMQAKRHSRASAEDFQEIDGVKEAHPARNAGECERLRLWFFQHNLRLTLRIKSNPMPGNRRQVLCVFLGKDARANRFAYNDMYREIGIPYPESAAEYPENPYVDRTHPFENPPNGIPKYIEDPNWHDTQRLQPQPPPIPDDTAPFTDEDAARLRDLDEYNRRHPKQ